MSPADKLPGDDVRPFFGGVEMPMLIVHHERFDRLKELIAGTLDAVSVDACDRDIALGSLEARRDLLVGT